MKTPWRPCANTTPLHSSPHRYHLCYCSSACAVALTSAFAPPHPVYTFLTVRCSLASSSHQVVVLLRASPELLGFMLSCHCRKASLTPRLQKRKRCRTRFRLQSRVCLVAQSSLMRRGIRYCYHFADLRRKLMIRKLAFGVGEQMGLDRRMEASRRNGYHHIPEQLMR